MWKTKDFLYSTGNSAQCAAAWTGGESGGEWTLGCVAESFAVHLKLSQHC